MPAKVVVVLSIEVVRAPLEDGVDCVARIGEILFARDAG